MINKRENIGVGDYWVDIGVVRGIEINGNNQF
jgi:hypothetical protein